MLFWCFQRNLFFPALSATLNLILKLNASACIYNWALTLYSGRNWTCAGHKLINLVRHYSQSKAKGERERERVPRYRICCRGHRRRAWRVSRCVWTDAPPDWQHLCNHGYSSGTWMVCLCCAADGETVERGKEMLLMTTPQRKPQD